MDLLRDPTNATTDALRCSAKGCRKPAVHGVRWNNPRLHTPTRRKVWLACDEHESSLRDFLRLRDFYVDTVPVSALTEADG